MSDVPGLEWVVDPECPPGKIYVMPDVKYQYGRIALTGTPAFDAAVAREMQGIQDELVTAFGDMARADAEWRTNGHIGPMHHPTRSDYRDIERAAWRRLDLQRRLARMGKPAGAFRRANNCDGETCPLGQAREFYNRESGEMICAGCWR